MIVDLFSKRATLESPSVSISDPAILDLLLSSGARSKAGIEVNPTTAMGLTPFWRGVTLIARSVAKLPVHVYRRIDMDSKERDIRHPAYQVIRNPNPDMTPFHLKQTLTMLALIHGNGYGWIIRDQGMRPMRIWPLFSVNTKPRYDEITGELSYISKIRNQDIEIAASDMLHIRGPSNDGVLGISVIQQLREALGHGLALQTFGNKFFANNARPSMILKHPGKLTDAAIKHLRESWMGVHGGPDNASKPAVLEEGMDVSPYQLSNEDAQFLGSREFNVRELANILHLPPHKLGDSSRTSYNSLEQENQAVLDDAYDPWLVTWEEEIESKLLTEKEKETDSHFVQFNRRELVRMDAASRSSSYATGLQNGYLSPNEVRAFENLNPIDGGDTYFIPVNLAQLDGVDLPMEPIDLPENESDRSEDRDWLQMGSDDSPESSVPVIRALSALELHITQTIDRFAKRILEGAKRASSKPEGFHSWLLDEMPKYHRSPFIDALGQPVAAHQLLTSGSTGSVSEEIADSVMARIQDDLNELSGHCRAFELIETVKAYTLETRDYAAVPIRRLSQ